MFPASYRHRRKGLFPLHCITLWRIRHRLPWKQTLGNNSIKTLTFLLIMKLGVESQKEQLMNTYRKVILVPLVLVENVVLVILLYSFLSLLIYRFLIKKEVRIL